MRWFFLLPANILMVILSAILAPILPFFANKEGYLPKWLWWFQTPDAPLDGDQWYLDEHAKYKGDPQTLPKWQRHINQVRWLYRNPSYGFDWTVMAFQYKEGDEVKVWGRRKINGEIVKNDIRLISGDLSMGGWFFARNRYAWQLYINHHWNKDYCTKLNFGWKLWSRNDLARDRKCMFVFSPTGFWKKIT